MATEVVFVIVNEVKMRFVTPHNLPPHNGGHGTRKQCAPQRAALPFLPIGRASKLPEKGILTKNSVSIISETLPTVVRKVSEGSESPPTVVRKVSEGSERVFLITYSETLNY